MFSRCSSFNVHASAPYVTMGHTNAWISLALTCWLVYGFSKVVLVGPFFAFLVGVLFWSRLRRERRTWIPHRGIWKCVPLLFSRPWSLLISVSGMHDRLLRMGCVCSHVTSLNFGKYLWWSYVTTICDLYAVGQHIVLCEATWQRFVALFE